LVIFFPLPHVYWSLVFPLFLVGFLLGPICRVLKSSRCYWFTPWPPSYFLVLLWPPFHCAFVFCYPFLRALFRSPIFVALFLPAFANHLYFSLLNFFLSAHLGCGKSFRRFLFPPFFCSGSSPFFRLFFSPRFPLFFPPPCP